MNTNLKIVFLFIIFIIYFYSLGILEKFKNKKIKKLFYVGECDYKVTKTIEKKLNNNNIFETTKNKDWSLFIPCTYDYIPDEIKKINKTTNSNNTSLFFIDGNDELASKINLWKNLVSHYDINEALKIMPMTFVLEDYKDIDKLKHKFDKNKYYILKKNTQRQDGIKITNKLEYIIKNKDDYAIVQELLINPYLIDNRKINIRIYMLIICQNDIFTSYIFDNGFLYYTKKKFIKNSKNTDNHITTGYIDRKVYDKNPLTISDLKIYLDNKNRKLSNSEIEILRKNNKLSEYLFDNIKNVIKKSIVSIKPHVCKKKKIKNIKKFELFGIDLFITDKLQCKIMEINKGPDLSSKDKRDGNVKNNLLNNIFEKVGVLKGNSKNLIKIL